MGSVNAWCLIKRGNVKCQCLVSDKESLWEVSMPGVQSLVNRCVQSSVSIIKLEAMHNSS